MLQKPRKFNFQRFNFDQLSETLFSFAKIWIIRSSKKKNCIYLVDYVNGQSDFSCKRYTF